MIQQILKQKQRFRSYQESGYSIVEGLVAMIMVAALMSAVAPIIAYSVGTRVQARKVELAAQAARSYIDAVRLGKLDPPPSLASDQEISADALTTCPQTQGGLLQYCPDPLNKFYCVSFLIRIHTNNFNSIFIIIQKYEASHIFTLINYGKFQNLCIFVTG